ncbi:MAG: carotenoid oxygenase family protein [Cyclobacteriaceae bacterium]
MTTRRRFVKNSMLGMISTWGALHGFSHTQQRDWSFQLDSESKDPFLSGNNAPVSEELIVQNLKVSGQIPTDIEGAFLRNGPNPKFSPVNYVYPFSGDGMVHAIYFDHGKVQYRNKWIYTERLKNDLKAGKALASRLETSNTNIIYHHGKIVTLNDVGSPYQIDRNLDTVGSTNFGEMRWPSAHPRIDPVTKELHVASYSRTAPYLIYYVMDKNGKVIRSSQIEIPDSTIIHDMVITPHYAIIVVCPVIFNVEKAKAGQNPFAWEPDKGTSIYVMERNNIDSPPVKLTTEPFFVWHFVNGFEESNQIHLDLVRHNDVPFVKSDRAYQYLPTSLHRISINLSTLTVKHKDFDDRRIEFPTINGQINGQPYRHGYSVVLLPEHFTSKPPEYFAQSIQYDVQNQSHKLHNYGKGRYTGELAFIPRKNSKSESDGYVISFVFDENTGKSDVVLLDANNFEKEPIAIIHLPVRVPNGLHGNWLPI